MKQESTGSSAILHQENTLKTIGSLKESLNQLLALKRAGCKDLNSATISTPDSQNDGHSF